jgi:AcrR family transcriptional regulator
VSDEELDRPEEAGMRDRIIAIALHRFARAGYGKTSVKDIAAEAGVTTGTVYYHFGSKLELYRETLRLAQGRLIAAYRRVAPATQGDESLQARVQAWFDALRDTVHEHEDNHWMGLTMVLDSARYASIAETRDGWAHEVEQLYRQLGDLPTGPDDTEWARDPFVVFMTVMTHGAACVVVGDGPDALPGTLRGFRRFLTPEASGVSAG